MIPSKNARADTAILMAWLDLELADFDRVGMIE